MRTDMLARLSDSARVLVLLIAIARLLLGIEAAVVQSAMMRRHPGPLALGVTQDVTLVLPGLYYLLAVRRGHLPGLSVVPAFAVSLAVARLLLPTANQGYLRVISIWAVPVIELCTAGYLVFQIGAIRRCYKSLSRTAIYPADAVAGSVRTVLGDTLLVSWLVTEMTLLFYALLGWSRSFRPRPDQQIFAYYRCNHYGPLLAVLLCLLPVETGVVHVAVARWSPLVAWIVTALSLYGALWLLGESLSGNRTALNTSGRRGTGRCRWCCSRSPRSALETGTTDPWRYRRHCRHPPPPCRLMGFHLQD